MYFFEIGSHIFVRLGYKVTFISYYIIAELSPSIILLYPPSPIPAIVLTGLIFPFTYKYTQYLYHIHPSNPLLHSSPSHQYQLPNSTCSVFLFSFVKKKKK
jgi:hypothetical protein